MLDVVTLEAFALGLWFLVVPEQAGQIAHRVFQLMQVAV